MEMASVSSSNVPVLRKKDNRVDFGSPTGNGHAYNGSKSLRGNSRLSKSLNGTAVVLFPFCFYFVTLLFVQHREDSFPTPRAAQDVRDQFFTEGRARKHLDAIVDLGPRVSGSAACMSAELYILSELKKIRSGSKQVHDIQVDHQRNLSGAFTLDFIGAGEFTNVYRNLSNVVAKLSPKDRQSDNSVLVNCHYDTWPDSPGASDDAVSCTLMLEALRALSQRDQPLTHNIIFLFNGAEENILQASHAFVTKHPWAKDVRAFVNLEAAGAGGWERVFQTGPEHPWLIRAYTQSARYPAAAVFNEELFQSGVVPADTDFRIFRDYGKIPGIDIAYVKNGFVYHTSSDVPAMIQPGCIQRGGENLLQLMVTLATSKELPDPGLDKHGHMVYFDFVGYFMVSYPRRIGNIINFVTLVAVVVTIGKKAMSRKSGQGPLMYYKALAGAVLGVLLTWLAMIVTVVLIAVLVHYLNRGMSWFTNSFHIIVLYILPAITSGLAVNTILKNTVFKKSEMWQMESIFFEANLTLLSSILAVLTWLGVGSAYLVLLFVLFPLLVRGQIHRFPNINFRDNHVVYWIISLLSMCVPMVIMIDTFYHSIVFFIPVFGRIGNSFIPDILISLLSLLPLIFPTGYHVGMVYPARHMRRMCSILGLVFLVSFALILVSPYSFPFARDKLSPSRQRVVTVHVERRFHDQSGKVTTADSYLWKIPSDSYEEKLIEEEVPELFVNSQYGSCDGPYCGHPFLLPVIQLFDPRTSLLLPAPSLNLPHRVSMTVSKQVNFAPGRTRLTLSVTGPDHMTAFLMPKPGVQLTWWSENPDHIPQPTKTDPILPRPNYFLYHADGWETKEPWTFSMEFDVDLQKQKSDAIVDIGFGGHYLHGQYQKTEKIKSYQSKLPDWTITSAWSSTYDMYTI